MNWIGTQRLTWPRLNNRLYITPRAEEPPGWISTSQKPFCGRPKLSNVRPLWVNIAHCPSVPRHPPKTQSLSKLSEGLKFAYTGHHTIENHLNIIDELYAILCGGRKKVTWNSYVGCGTKPPVEKMSAESESESRRYNTNAFYLKH